ncbi:zinc ribbon domain-containing protein [Paenibacillus sp.]|uniref:zinc ribbon domain-containing protein n=1 Tax=Paenibacillus sp. TaxID=58172 RepID=UPI0028AF15B7|nr:zinc ribbon domain-containing protein [Paenibacillus sp.]
MEQEHVGQEQGELKFCQSCGMPMPTEELLGTNQEGEKIEDYCVYCYEDGAFKQPDITLQEMADICTGYMVQEGMDEAVARKLLAEQLPHLKRWREETASSSKN